jgi:predicted site-specific integrase-resolvase
MRKEKQTASPGDGFIDTAQLRERVPVSSGTLFNWRKSGKIPYVALGRRVLFHWESVQSALLRAQRGGVQ